MNQIRREDEILYPRTAEEDDIPSINDNAMMEISINTTLQNLRTKRFQKLDSDQLELATYDMTKNGIFQSFAGCGKTTSSECRVIDWIQSGIGSSDIIYFTVTDNARKEAVSKLRDLNEILERHGAGKIQIHTWHSFCLQELKIYYKRIFGRRKKIDVLDDEMLTKIIRNILKLPKNCVYATKYSVKKVKEEYDMLNYSLNLLKKEENDFEKDSIDLNKILRKEIGLYEKTNTEQLSFSDMLVKYVQLVKDGKLDFVQYKKLLLDECQDLKINHYQVFKMFWENPQCVVCLIGDEFQNILESTPKFDIFNILRSEENIIRGTLRSNYRCRGSIFDLGLRILGKARVLDEEEDGEGEESDSGGVWYYKLNDFPSQLSFIAKKVRVRGNKSVGILSRTNSTLDQVAKYLGKQGIKYKFLKEVKEDRIFHNQVILSTMHFSKGSEFDIVFIINFVALEIPYLHFSLSYNNEVERNLFYVAVTRAKREVNLLYVGNVAESTSFATKEVKSPGESEFYLTYVKGHCNEIRVDEKQEHPDIQRVIKIEYFDCLKEDFI